MADTFRGALKKAQSWKGRHLLGTRGLTRAHILSLLDVAAAVKATPEGKLGSPLKGKRVFNFFVEPSTRTKTSFSIAARKLGCETVDFSPTGSSLKKGESLIDTAKTIESIGVDFVVIRHHASGAPHFLASRIGVPVLNAGDGWHEHPTQALLDLLTIRERLGTVQKLRVLLVGDITHSRVARSNLWAHQALGNDVTLVGPPTLIPPGLKGVKVSHDFDAALEKAQVVMMHRIQKERLGQYLFPSESEYTNLFGLTPERFARFPEKAIVMHPGPMNRGLELCSEAADSDRSVILHQVANGVFVRMAALLVLSGKTQ